MKRVILKVSAFIMAFLSASVLFITPLVSHAATAQELRSAVVSVAVAENGYRPAVDNQTKYGAWYGWQGPWCTMFALWCTNQASINTGVSMRGVISPTGGSTDDMLSWFRSHESYQSRGTGYIPREGDWIFFRGHVGLVENVNGATITTIEGNISRPDGVSVVARRSYNVGNGSILGYGVPKYENLSDGVAIPPPAVVVDTVIEPFQGMVNTQLLNVRSAPNMSASQLAQLSYGAVCTVTATNGEWYKIEGGVNGYVRSAYVIAYVPAPVAPVVEAEPQLQEPSVAQAKAEIVAPSEAPPPPIVPEVVSELLPETLPAEEVTRATSGDCTAHSTSAKDMARTLEQEQEKRDNKEDLKPKLISIGMSGLGAIGMAVVLPALNRKMGEKEIDDMPQEDE